MSSEDDGEFRRQVAHTAWWGMVICALGALAALVKLALILTNEFGS